jgi:hypothetical protein
MREYGFTITEHDPDRPWMVLASEHRAIKLPDGGWTYSDGRTSSGQRHGRPLSSTPRNSPRRGRIELCACSS